MDGAGAVAIIFCCGLFADNLVKGEKIKALQKRVAKLEEVAERDNPVTSTASR